jgi:hypothetical protein
MAYNNTYNFQAISEAQFESANSNVTACLEMIYKCRVIADVYDPSNLGINYSVNSVCSGAYGWCYLNVGAAYLASEVSLSSLINISLLTDDLN